MDNDYGIFVTSERIRSRLTKACTGLVPKIPLYKASDEIIGIVTNMRYAIVIGEQVDEFCRKLRDKGIMVFRYGPTGDGNGQILLSSFLKDRNLLNTIVSILDEFSLHLTKVYSPINAAICANPNKNESLHILRDEYDDLVARSLMLEMIFNQKFEEDILRMVEMARSYYYQL